MMKKCASVFVAGWMFLGGCSGGSTKSSGSTTPIPTVTLPCQSIAVPAYFYPTSPTSDWNTAISDSPWNAKVSRTMIMNPNSGPGASVDANYVSMVKTVHQAGGKVYGYVPTGYGADALATVEGEIQQYIHWYGVDGIFLDEASENATDVTPYYQPLVTYITSNISGGGVILNPGVYPDESYAKMTVPSTSSLKIVVFEHDYTSFIGATAAVPSWAASYPPSLFIDIVYNTAAANVANTLTLSVSRNVGGVYVTDQNLPNPYTTLPSYWSSLVQSTQAGC